MAGLPGVVDGKRFLRAMARLGWNVETTRGSHHKLRHARTGGVLIIAFHGKLSRNSVKRALKIANVDETRFLDVY